MKQLQAVKLPALSGRSRLLLWAVLPLAACLFKPTLPLPRPVYDWFLVLDITQSMNVRDYAEYGQAASRLQVAKQAMRQALRALPCGSHVALGLFTERNTINTMRPLEVCAHFDALDQAVASMDWRMAWAADSFITHGVFDAIAQAPALGKHMRVAFISDGQQAPPSNPRYMPKFDGKPGVVKGILFGAGSTVPQPIPKLDENDNIDGYWELEDVQRYATFGMAEVQSVLQMESHGRNAPHGIHPQEIANANLSALDADNLHRLAKMTGLAYARLDNSDSLASQLTDYRQAKWRLAPTDLRPMLASLALLLLLRYYLPGRYLTASFFARHCRGGYDYARHYVGRGIRFFNL